MNKPRSSKYAAAQRAPVRVLVADGSSAYRTGVRIALEGSSYVVCAEAGDAASAIVQAESTKPAVCLIEVRLPGDGLGAVAQIARALPKCRIVILTSSEDARDFVETLRLGAAGYLLKSIEPGQLPRALDACRRGEALVPRAFAGYLVDELRRSDGRRTAVLADRPDVRLRGREWEVLEHMNDGRTTQQIAAAMGISQATVRSHVSRLLDALEVETRAEAVGLLRKA